MNIIKRRSRLLVIHLKGEGIDVLIAMENGKRAIDIDKNWTGRIENLTCIIQLWCKRDLSIMGKIVIVNIFW